MEKRDTALDSIRGIAIFLMVQANITGSVFSHPYPEWMQTYVAIGSFVPALFVVVAGMMVVYTTIHKQYTLKHFLLRGGMLLFTAAVILDVLIWEIVPFIGVEILYLIALALPLSYLFQRLDAFSRWCIVGVIFMATPFLQVLLGYAPHPIIISLFEGTFFAEISGQTSILNHWIIDGWFPLFPWLGFAFLGVNIGLLRFKELLLSSFASKRVVFAGFSAVLFGIFLWSFYSGPLYIREGFSETIYPATLAYMVTSIGQIILLLALLDWRPHFSLYKPLHVLGESSLFIYIMHFIIIDFLALFSGFRELFITVVATLMFLFALAYFLRRVRKKWPKRPLALRYILGI